MHESMKDLAAKGLVKSRLQAMEQNDAPLQPKPSPIYANIPKNLGQAPQRPPRPQQPAPQPKTEYANIPNIPSDVKPEKIGFERNDQRSPLGAPKEQSTIELPDRWTGKGTFVANTSNGLLFKLQGADKNDGLVKFSPEQSKTMLDADRKGLIKKSMQEVQDAGPMTVAYFKDGAQADWRVHQPEQDQPQRGGRK